MQRFDWNSEDGYMDRYDDGLYVLHSDAQAEIARLTAERDQALARAAEITSSATALAAAAAMEMRERAHNAACVRRSVGEILKAIHALPIDPDAQKALDKMLAKAREDAIMEAADIVNKNRDISGWVSHDTILALLNDGDQSD